MALYERQIGEQQFRAFTEDGSDEDVRMAALVQAGTGGWKRVRLSPTPTEPFDPAAHDVPAVLAHLEAADADEARRVLDAEAAEGGKQRKGILGLRDEILARKKQED